MLDVVGSDGLESLHAESARNEAGIDGTGKVGGGRVRLTLKASIAFVGVGRKNLGCNKFSLGSIRSICHDHLQDGSPGRCSGGIYPNEPTNSKCAAEDGSRPTVLSKRNSGPPNGPAIRRSPL
jgi:hypothetical protein